MKTPIYDFLKQYDKENPVRLHMPGSKGKINIPFGFDITEIDGADFLFSPSGIIKESEINASILFNTGATLYSTEGSSLCIKTMIALLKKAGVTRILAARNAHVSFLNACVLSDMEVTWIYPDGKLTSICSGDYAAKTIDKALKKTRIKAVYVTSPDYLGNILDIKALSEVCKKHGAYLIVDNAHGAYLKFLAPDLHPISQGADMCCDSAHKTLPVMTGGAYLHINKNTNETFIKNAKSVMSVFATTSPSYMIMASLDFANKIINDEIRRFNETALMVERLKSELLSLGFINISREPFKIAIDAVNSNINAYELYRSLREKNVVSEYYDEAVLVMMFSALNGEDDYIKTLSAFKEAVGRIGPNCFEETKLIISEKVQRLNMRDAFFADSEDISIDLAKGRICSQTKTVCPPCIPIICTGEVFDENAIKILKKYGILNVSVVK